MALTVLAHLRRFRQVVRVAGLVPAIRFAFDPRLHRHGPTQDPTYLERVASAWRGPPPTERDAARLFPAARARRARPRVPVLPPPPATPAEKFLDRFRSRGADGSTP